MIEVKRVALVSLGLLGGCAAPEASGPAREADEREIKAVLEGWVAASVDGNADAYGSFITDDFVYLGPGAAPIEGKATVVEWVSGFFGATSFGFEWATDEIVLSGDLAVHRYSGVATMESTNGGDPRRLDRKYIDILRRVDGRWLTSRHMYNLND
jgi:uncharacterized protein (TIGR02246 family)